MTNVQQVNSSLIGGIGYNPLTEQLSVTMRAAPRTTYVYRGVDRGTANSFADASSKGKFFNSKIRGRFQSTKVAS